MYANPVQVTLSSTMGADAQGNQKKYIRLKVYKDRIEQTISKEKIEFENALNTPMNAMPGSNRGVD